MIALIFSISLICDECVAIKTPNSVAMTKCLDQEKEREFGPGIYEWSLMGSRLGDKKITFQHVKCGDV